MIRDTHIRWWMPAFFLLLVSFFLGGCADDEQPQVEEGIVFQLSLPGRIDVTTRTHALSGITITDVWVVQYNADNGAFLFAKNFTGSAIGEATNNESIINVNTSDFSNHQSRFYIIVNAGTDFLTGFNGTEPELKQKTLDITPGTTYGPTLLTTGPLAYTPAATGLENAGKVVLVAPLQRTFACVELKWTKTVTFKGTIKVTGVKAYNLPTKMALYTRGGADLTGNYPALDALSVTSVDIGSSELPLGSPCTFYMGENLRGMGTGTSFAEKNLKGKGPGADGSLAGCTNLVLAAEYTYPGATAPINVEYRIYLGGNLMNDYNIQRGNKYTLTVNISGANSGDVRVTITDGNVVVFDDVEEINKEVEFR